MIQVTPEMITFIVFMLIIVKLTEHNDNKEKKNVH